MTEQELDSLLRAVANSSRRKILKLVWKRKMAAGDIATRLGLAGASVSEHLKVLRKSGLVVLEREGTWWFYRADQQKINRLIQLVAWRFPLDEKDSETKKA